MSRRGSYTIHLVRRFFETLSARPPDPEQESWARALLLPGEVELWDRMRPADRRHAVGVARETERLLSNGSAGVPAGRPPREVLAAALLHDVGKVCDDLGAPARAVATAVGRAVGPRQVRPYSDGGGPLAKIARYLDHPAIGARLLEAAGSDPVTVRWAADHHLPPDRWRVPSRYADALKQADDD